MPMAPHLLYSVFRATSPAKRIRAMATVIMWFAAGAYVTSYIESLISQDPSGLAAEFVGGAVAAVAGIVAKAV